MNRIDKKLMNMSKARQREEMILAGCYNKASHQVHRAKNKYTRKKKHRLQEI